MNVDIMHINGIGFIVNAHKNHSNGQDEVQGT